MRRMFLACSTIWLAGSSSGCTTLALFKSAPVAAVVAQCPPLKDYDKDTLAKSARELRGLLAADPKAATPELMQHYRALRDSCRAQEKGPP